MSGTRIRAVQCEIRLFSNGTMSNARTPTDPLTVERINRGSPNVRSDYAAGATSVSVTGGVVRLRGAPRTVLVRFHSANSLDCGAKRSRLKLSSTSVAARTSRSTTFNPARAPTWPRRALSRSAVSASQRATAAVSSGNSVSESPNFFRTTSSFFAASSAVRAIPPSDRIGIFESGMM